MTFLTDLFFTTKQKTTSLELAGSKDIAMNNDPLLQPQRLGNLTLPHRVVMTAVKLGYATKTGEVTERHVAFYRRRAQAGAALIVALIKWTGFLFVRRPSRKRMASMLQAMNRKDTGGALHEAKAVGGQLGEHVVEIDRQDLAADFRPGKTGDHTDLMLVLGQTIAELPHTQEIGQVVEGVKAAKAVHEVAEKLGIEMPIVNVVYRILYEGLSPREAVGTLMKRQLKPESA